MEKEKSYLNEEEKKKLRLSEQEKKQEIEKQVAFKKTKEKISTEVEAEQELAHLKELLSDGKIQSEQELENLQDLVSDGKIEAETLKHIAENKELQDDTIEEIFQKIEEIETIENIENYIPKEMRITKEDYKQAVEDAIFRVKILTKTQLILALVSEEIQPAGVSGANIFSGFMSVLDKNLITIQEHHIDMKNNLEALDKKEESLSWWKRFLKLLQDIFK